MSKNSTETPILAETEFAGEISIGGKTAPITFRASAGGDCRLRLRAGPVSNQSYLLTIQGKCVPGTPAAEFALTGKSEDGKSIASDSVATGLERISNDGTFIVLKSRICKITLPIRKSVEKPILRLWFRSFLTFRNPIVETVLGRLTVQGDAKDVKPDDMSGSVTLEAPSDVTSGDWYQKADNFLRHMHRGLALAHGGRLQTPRLDYIHGSVWEATFFAGNGFRPELPVQHRLNQGPFIKALAERYDRTGSLPDILWTALGWMQTDTTFDEVRFLTAMTALEAIIANQLPKHRGANRRTFAQGIVALFSHYKIPKRDFEGDEIRNLVKLRNDIVHRGVVPDDADIWKNIILVRELITRILLKEIGFVGRYCCYVGGLNDRDFPGQPEETASE